jgi:hypothetical protein
LLNGFGARSERRSGLRRGSPHRLAKRQTYIVSASEGGSFGLEGGLAGGTVGNNWQNGTFVFGIEPPTRLTASHPSVRSEIADCLGCLGFGGANFLLERACRALGWSRRSSGCRYLPRLSV